MQSMTGFATVERRVLTSGAQLRWDLKSVNARGLDVKLRAPAAFAAEESGWRALISKHVARGSVSVALTVTQETDAPTAVLNPAALAAAAAWMAEAEQALHAAGASVGPAAPEALLAIRGVLEAPGPDAAAEADGAAALTAAATDALAEGLAGLVAARAAEGARLKAALTDLIDEVAAGVGRADTLSQARSESAAGQLRDRVAALVGAGAPLDEARLGQELAQLAVKLDTREEVDRLNAHVAAARALLASDQPVGRKLDFLTQEFNREANTLCAKSQDSALTEIGLALKVTIDQLREQSANVE